MNVHYQVSDTADGLKVVVIDELSIRLRVLIAVVFGAPFFAATRAFFGYWSVLIALIAATLMLLGNVASRVELRATKFELVAAGNLGRRGSRTTRVVCTGDIRRLEFRDLAGNRRGLYAVTNRTAHLILPFLDYAQTMEVIRAIKEKFPGLAEAWREESPSTRNFLTLGLGRLK